MTPTELLAAAERLLERSNSRVGAAHTLAAALLARQALERALDAYWEAKRLPLHELPMAPQLICLPEYLGDEALAASVRHSWGALSDACHHHAYEIAPSAAELRGWFQPVARFVRQAATAGEAKVRQ